MKRVTLTKIGFIAAIILCMTPWVSAPIALVCGFMFTLLFGNPFASQTGKYTSLLLKVSVVGLGFGMNLDSVIQTGNNGLILTIFSITIVLTLGYIIGKQMHLPKKISHLIASGTAICGGSAIAAVAPTVKANENEISVSLGVVFFLNSIALILFPILGTIFNLDQQQFGLWSAIAIHDTSSVVGAASAYGEEALKIAVTVKLARALWIIPVSILSSILFKNSSRKISIPWFILLFVLAVIATTYVQPLEIIAPSIVSLSKAMLVVTLFLVGSSLSIAKLKAVGIKPLLLGISLWFTISVLSLMAILFIL